MRAQYKTSEFKRCVKLLDRRRWDLSKLAKVMNKLAADMPSSELFKDHPLAGRFSGKRECHVTSITNDWILVYHKTEATASFSTPQAHILMYSDNSMV